MIAQTISRDEARRIYNRLGHNLDRATRFERRAKQVGLRLLESAPGQRIVQIGVGTGVEQAALVNAVGRSELVVGCDLSRGMLQLTRQRANTPLCEGDAAHLPFATGSVDRLFSAYTLDLIPATDLPVVLAEFRRILRPGGRLVLVSLTEGVDMWSRLFVAGWKLIYRLDPQRLGGCRPLKLSTLLDQAGFVSKRHVVVQRGFPSEVLIAREALILAKE